VILAVVLAMFLLVVGEIIAELRKYWRRK